MLLHRMKDGILDWAEAGNTIIMIMHTKTATTEHSENAGSKMTTN